MSKKSQHQIVYRRLSELKKLPNNPRTIKKDDMERLKKSVKDNPDYFEARPVILSDRTGELVIIAGNQRFEAAKALGLSEIPTVLLEGLTKEREREIVIRDNVANGDWDMDILANEWDADELADWGVEVDWDTPEEIVEDEAPEVDESAEPESKRGEIYQLGEHRLMCGDSTVEEDVERLMGGLVADIVFTSPPYNVGHSDIGVKKSTKKSKYINSEDDLTDYDDLLFNSTKNAILFSKYSFINIQLLQNNKTVLCDFLNEFRDYLCDIEIWHKTTAQPAMARRVMNSQFEFIFVFSKENQTRAIGTKDFRGTVSNIFTCPSQHKNDYADIHSATFPMEFVCYHVKNFANKEDKILDIFGGTGTTLIACEQLGRKCYMMELDQKYCDVIRKRYWKFKTGSEEGWKEGTPCLKK